MSEPTAQVMSNFLARQASVMMLVERLDRIMLHRDKAIKLADDRYAESRRTCNLDAINDVKEVFNDYKESLITLDGVYASEDDIE